MKRTVKAMINDLVSGVKKNVKDLLLFVYFACSIASVAFCSADLRLKWIIGNICTFVAVFLLIKYIEYSRRLNKDDHRPKERYTKKLSNGDIVVEDAKLHQAIVYLSILEDENEKV